MAESKKPKPASDNRAAEMDSIPGAGPFEGLLSKLLRVPKRSLDEALAKEKRDKRRVPKGDED